MAGASRVGWLRLIAAFKLLKALVLLGSLAILFKVVREDDPAHTLIRWALSVHVDPHNHYLRSILAALFQLDPKKFALLVVGAALYATLFAVEGIGLWFAQLWAEYLTIMATAGFIPVEVYEIIHGVNTTKVVALALNVAIVAYLVMQVRGREEPRGGLAAPQFRRTQ